MRLHQWGGSVVLGALLLALTGTLVAFGNGERSARFAPQMAGKIEASIFAYDGKDFVRTSTTLMTESGQSAVNSKLDHDTPAFKALAAKRSFTGDVVVFGHNYAGNYAPLIGADGKLTGALFVGITK